jgi:hypothetical protein
MVIEALAIGGFSIGIYNLITNSTFRGRVETKLEQLNALVASKSTTVAGVESKVEGVVSGVEKVL